MRALKIFICILMGSIFHASNAIADPLNIAALKEASLKGDADASATLYETYLKSGDRPQALFYAYKCLDALKAAPLMSKYGNIAAQHYYALSIIEMVEKYDLEPRDFAEMKSIRSDFASESKRFSLEATCSNGKKETLYIYAWDWDRDYDTASSQVDWAKIYRGCNIPDGVSASFRKLFKIARDNHVSIKELAAGALNEGAKTESTASPAAQAIAECDHYAARPFDKQARAPGVAFTDIKVSVALGSCQRAVELSGDATSVYQLGRVYDAANEFAKAQSYYFKAAKSGHNEAFYSLGYLAHTQHIGISEPFISWQTLATEAMLEAYKRGAGGAGGKDVYEVIRAIGAAYYEGVFGYPYNPSKGIDC